jgi:hypothetical protein
MFTSQLEQMIYMKKINHQIDQQCANNGTKRMHALSKEERTNEPMKHKQQQQETY